eukprot:gene28689-31857_t
MLKNTLGPAAAVSQQQFAELLLKVGEGSADNPFPIPPDWCVPDPSLKGLISDVYGDLCDESACSADHLIKRCILTPKNDGVQEINDKIMDLFKGNDANIQPRIYFSHDYANDEEDVALYPTEFLNSLDPQGLPPHELKLKVGCPIILLRNLNPRKGLANGTRLIVEELRNHLIVAKIVTGSHAGETVCIPRIPLTPSDSKQNPIIFTRRQFPIRPAFAMTINKSQGQTFEKIGIYLPAPCFSHGQLYVAMSRVGQPTGLKFLVKNATEGQAHTENVVYAEVIPTAFVDQNIIGVVEQSGLVAGGTEYNCGMIISSSTPSFVPTMVTVNGAANHRSKHVCEEPHNNDSSRLDIVSLQSKLPFAVRILEYQ